MTVKTFVIFVLCIALVGCGRGSEETAKPAAATPPAAEQDTHKEDATTVEVDQAMLRDLRITTRPVESRTGGDLLMLLGELAVDQRAYAEVGTPVAARVTRLLVNAGDRVRSDQTLAELTSPELGRARGIPFRPRTPDTR
jgi:cobalt-zinc-cadmium efflux system membrane fusion protein